MSKTAFRLIKTLQLIPRHSADSRRRIGTTALLEKLKQLGFNISLRSLQRDLKSLQEAFPGLANDGNRDMPGWYWEEDAETLDIPAMDPSMALSFKVTEKFLAPAMPSLMRRLDPYIHAADKLLNEQRPNWLDRIRVEPRSMPLLPAAIADRCIDVVYGALISGNRFRGRYRRRDGAVAEYELSPLGLVLRNEVSYLVATAWDYDDPRHYALHRFEADTLEPLETAAHEPEGFDFDAYLDNGGFQYRLSADPLRLRLRMRTETAAHLQETPLSEDQSREELTEGWVRIEASVADTRQLRWWLLGLGPQVVVEAPDTLAREIAEDLRQGLEAYTRTR